MKLLLTCVNSSYSLIGFDWDAGRVFWSVPASKIRVCSGCYDGTDLLVASGNVITRFSPQGSSEAQLSGQYDALAHSIHIVGGGLIGVADTGNSQIVFFDKEGRLDSLLRPLEFWKNIPHDAIHLNDFVVTPHGVLGSCFDYRPWREVLAATSRDNWCFGRYGLILNLTGTDQKGFGRIAGCGFDHPHSLHYVEPNLYLCSSATGVFHVCELREGGFVQEKRRYQVTTDHFLRGAHQTGNHWFLGGSSKRHGTVLAKTVEVYRLDEATGAIATKSIEWIGEIYDILPWNEDILAPIIQGNFRESI